LQKKYGSDKVGHVLTTQTIGAKESLRDIARVYGYETAKSRSSSTRSWTISFLCGTITARTPQFKTLIDSDKYYLEIVSLASKIEGLPRQAGLHAAGVVLNNEPLVDVLPVTDNPGVGEVACLEKDYLEEQGFLKMDILGFRNLTIIDTCLALIAKDGGPPHLRRYPLRDEPSIALVNENKTMGLFQLESPG
jgi:DNA polymerase-3 subunit alpha